MVWFWISVIGILILTGLAVYWAVRLRRRRFERKLRLEITNQGNVESHYQLLAQELSGKLEFRFSLVGDRLPEVIELDPAALPSSGQAQPGQASTNGSGVKSSHKAQNAMNISYAMASLLTSLGSILPGGLGSRVSQAGSQMYRGQAQASRVQQVSSQAAALAPGSPARSPEEAAPRPLQTSAGQGRTISWVETPPIQPGQALWVDLLVRSAWVAEDMILAFQIKSRSTEGGQGREVVEDGQIDVRGGFWSHRVYPHLLILALAILALFLALWIARMNGVPV